MDWRADILRDITVLPQLGVPGTIVVCGDESTSKAVLTGKHSADVLIAAAQLGSGRIVAITHSAYVNDLAEGRLHADKHVAQLQNNLKRWLTRGGQASSSHTVITNANKTLAPNAVLPAGALVVWCGGQSAIPSHVVEKFVAAGGGFLHSCCPWGFMQGNPGKTPADIPYSDLLCKAGICYTDNYIEASSSAGYVVAENKASDSNLCNCVCAATVDLEVALNNAPLLRNMSCVPQQMQTMLAPSLQKLFVQCDKCVVKCFPSKTSPVSTGRDKAMLDIWSTCAHHGDEAVRSGLKAPGCHIFPGDFSCAPVTEKCELTIHTVGKDEWVPTGCYLPAGVEMKVVVLGTPSQSTGWKMRVGCHSDSLINVSSSLRRWPDICQVKHLDKASLLKVVTPFGGSIYMGGPRGSLKARLENVVKSPTYGLSNTREEWLVFRQNPGLWADLSGELITITIPSKNVHCVENPAEVLRCWDALLRAYHDLRGTDVTAFKREWVVADEQPSAGYMHCGYPVVTEMDVANHTGHKFLLDVEAFKTGKHWGLFHELGHNMQRKEWTFAGTVEVTVNIFTLYGMEKLCGMKVWMHSWLKDQLKDVEKFLKKQPTFEKWKSSAGVALFIYAQLAHDFGWNSYKTVFRRYESMTSKQKPSTDQAKMDLWFETFSEIVGYDLSPMAAFWTIPLSEQSTKKTGLLPAYLPDDEITRMVPETCATIVHRYPNIVRHVSKP